MLIGFQNITFEFGARIIVADATWHIQPGERIGLVGYNGTGKSTLLKILYGEYHVSEGTVEKAKDLTIGFLHQDLLGFESDASILHVAMMAFDKILKIQDEIDRIGKEIENGNESETILEQYSEKLHEMEILDGYSIEHRTEEVLQGLGFSNEDLKRPYREFSGGWRMRVLLARMILQEPDLLLLDEPTNHLDLPSIEWLEKYLRHYKGSVVIVSHDRYFLNKMVTKIVELYQKQLHIYNGDYSFYEQEKEIRITQQQKAYKNQQEYIKQQERFIERFRSKATKAAAAQSAIKRLDKLDIIENVELEKPEMKINFQLDRQPGKIICELKKITKHFGKNFIIQNANATIERGDKIALIGANGKGKSTILRIIAGTEPYQEGKREWGYNISSSFYAQHQLEALKLNNSVLEELKECGSGKTEQEIRNLLGCFLFSGDDADKVIKVLSGGEKARVALAKVIASKSNFLLLDEPTNHLDINSVELLSEALNKYEGSYLLVSHDRYFISKTANKIWEIQDKQIVEFKGTYAEYLQWTEEKGKRDLELKAIEKELELGSGKKTIPEKGKKEPEIKSSPKIQPISVDREELKEYERSKKKFEKTENKLNTLEKRKIQMETEMADPEIYKDLKLFKEKEIAYGQLIEEIHKENMLLEALFEKIMDWENKN